MKAVNAQTEEMRQFVVESWAWITDNSTGILVALIAGAALVAVLMGVRSFGRWLLKHEHRSLFTILLGRVIAATQIWFMAMLAVELVADIAIAPPAIARLVHSLFTIALALQAAIWLREFVLGWVEQRATGSEGDHRSLQSALGIIRLLVSVAAFALAIILILDNLGVNVTALVAGLGVGGIAIGLAAQGIFSDLFAALSILFDKPFRKGDAISWDQSAGVVEAIGLKTTRVRALTGERVIISNANLLSKELHNLERLERRRITFTLGLIYQTPPDKMEALPGMLKDIVSKYDHCQFVRSSFLTFNASSLDYELVFEVVRQDYNKVIQLRTQVALDIIRLFAAEGLEFAYPTQTTFTAAPDGTMVLPYAEGKASGSAV